MGYEIHIQREDDNNKIKVFEWKNYINSDSEFVSIKNYSGELSNDNIITVLTPNAGLWKSENGEIPFTFSEDYGWISVKNPDEWIINKMILIANDLGAIVLGEEGEKYDKDNLLGLQPKDDNKINNRKWWQFWKTNKISYPESLESDVENDLFIGDCFCSPNKDYDIGLVVFEIYQGESSKYYSFAPVLLDNEKNSMNKFKNGQIKFQPNLGKKSFGIPAIGVMDENYLKELKKFYYKKGNIKFKKPIPNSTSLSYLLDFTEKSLTEFVEELEMYFSEKERKKVDVSKLIK